MYDALYQNSLCVGSWLHNYRISKEYRTCVKEVCEKCKDVQYFRVNIPDKKYLSYHIRESLQPDRKVFYHEYPQYTEFLENSGGRHLTHF